MSEQIQLIKGVIEKYFQVQRSSFNDSEINGFDELLKIGVLDQEGKSLVLNNESEIFLSALLNVSEQKMGQTIPSDISDAYKFIFDFEDYLRKEYSAKIYNAYSEEINKLRRYVLKIKYNSGEDLLEFALSINKNEKHIHLSHFLDDFLSLIPHLTYSSQQLIDFCNSQYEFQGTEYLINSFLKTYPKFKYEQAKEMLVFAEKVNVKKNFTSFLLIGLYNQNKDDYFDKIIDLEHKESRLVILANIDFKSKEDIDKCLTNLVDLELNNVQIARMQLYIFENIIKNKLSSDTNKEICFKNIAHLIKDSSKEVADNIISSVEFINDYEDHKYAWLKLYLINHKDLNVIRRFFTSFKDPVYVFDIMMRLFHDTPDYSFSTSLFKNGISYGWNTNQEETEKHILNLFKQHPAFGILGVKVIFTSYHGIFQVDLLKLDRAEYQINAINSICKHPHSFDKLLPLILPLRNSKFKKVREHLQNQLAQKVFSSYHETIYNQIENSISKNKKDKRFIEPIKKALDSYKELKKLKESINDLNPYENEQDLMDLYYRLEHEASAKMMNEVNSGKGTFMEMIKPSIIVRGNSFKFDEKDPTPLTKTESSMLIDGSSYLNPDLYEYNLNIT